MPSNLIAVEDGLDPVEKALKDAGFRVTRLANGMHPDLSAAVVTGLSHNVMGLADTGGNRFPIINASGMTPEEIVSQVQARGLQ